MRWVFVDQQDNPLRDKQGRAIGTQVRIGRYSYEPSGEGVNEWYTWPAGNHYGYEPHLLRDGKPYGSSNSLVMFTTPELRDHAARQYVLQAARRAFKAQHAKGRMAQVFGRAELVESREVLP